MVEQGKSNRKLLWILGGALVVIFLVSRSCQPEGSTTTATPAVATATTGTAQTKDQRLTQWLGTARDASAPASRRLNYAQSVLREGAGTAQANAAKALIPELQKAAIAEEGSRSDWSYSTEKDALSGKTTYYANVLSSNTIEFGFPYQGAQNGQLSIRRHPQYGRNVILQIERGQILCSSYGDCSIKIAFDQNPPFTIQGNEPADNNNTTVFLPYSLVSRIAKASEMRISFNAYQEGAPTLIFPVKNLDKSKL
jgi:hypothetical protein